MRRVKPFFSVLTALCLLSVFLLSSCETIELPSRRKMSRVVIDDFLVKQENRDSIYQTVTQPDVFRGSPVGLSGSVLFTRELNGKNAILRVYNIPDQKLLTTLSQNEQLDFLDNLLTNHTASGLYMTRDGETMRIFDANGALVVSAAYNDTEQPTIQDSPNGFLFNGAAFVVRDGLIVTEESNPLESEFFSAAQPYNGYFYYCSEQYAFVFQEQGNLIYSFTVPSYGENAHIFVLSGGNILIQYSYTALEGEEFDYVQDGVNKKLISLLVNIKTVTENPVALSFLVDEIHNPFTDPDFHEVYTEKVINAAKIREISNKRLDENMPARPVCLSDMLIQLFVMGDDTAGTTEIQRLSYDRYLLTTLAGGLLVNGRGELIGQLNQYRLITEKFIVVSGQIYDHDLHALFDMTVEDYTLFGRMGDNLILSKTTEDGSDLYLFTGEGSVQRICGAADFVESFEGYGVKNGEGYRYYNENGELIVATSGLIHWIYTAVQEDTTVCLGYVTKDGVTTYYRLSFDMAMNWKTMLPDSLIEILIWSPAQNK